MSGAGCAVRGVGSALAVVDRTLDVFLLETFVATATVI